MIHRSLGGLIALASVAAVSVPASAQDPQTRSPASKLDLTRPQFDTTTPAYNLDDAMGKGASTIVAEVDGTPITLGQVGDAIRELHPGFGGEIFQTLFPRVLDKLIRQEALVRSARRQHLDDNAEVRRHMKTAADYVLANEFVQRQTTAAVTEQMLLDRYARDIAGKPGPEEVHLRIILVQTEAEAAAVIAELKGGADFALVAQRSSRDPSAVRGGDLGFQTRDDLNAETGTAAFLLQPGQITPFPVRTGSAWCVAKVEERRTGTTPSFPAMREQLANALRRERVGNVVQTAMDGIAVFQHSLMGKEHQSEIAR